MSSACGTGSVGASIGGVVVIWIDWYPYHVARFRGLQSSPAMAGKVMGIEMVGGVGLHAGLKFREPLPADLPIVTLMPDSDWQSAGQWALALKLCRTLGKIQPDTVLVPGYYTVPAIAAAVWAKLHGRRSVLMTESTAGDHVRTGWREKLKSWLIVGLFDWAVTGGTAHRRYLTQLGFPAERVVGGYDVVENSFFEAGARHFRDNAVRNPELPANYFLYVGRLSSEKNVDGLLRSWNDYRASGGRWGLVLVGSGPAEKELRQTAALSGFGNEVHFAGHKKISDLPAYYAHAACFILPSTREPWGLVVNEALASGLPVIVSTRCGCAEELVQHEVNGFVFDPQEANQLLSLLIKMEQTTGEERTRMGSHSLNIVRRFSPSLFGEEVGRIHRDQGPAHEPGLCDLAEES